MNWPSFSAASTSAQVSKPSICRGCSHKSAARADNANMQAAAVAVTERNQFMGSLPLFVDYSHRAGPSGGGPVHLDREAHHLEPVRRQLLEIMQLLQMRVANLAAGAMAFPDQSRVTGFRHLAARVRERRIPAPRIGADETHAAFQQP